MKKFIIYFFGSIIPIVMLTFLAIKKYINGKKIDKNYDLMLKENNTTFFFLFIIYLAPILFKWGDITFTSYNENISDERWTLICVIVYVFINLAVLSAVIISDIDRVVVISDDIIVYPSVKSPYIINISKVIFAERTVKQRTEDTTKLIDENEKKVSLTLGYSNYFDFLRMMNEKRPDICNFDIPPKHLNPYETELFKRE